MVTTYFSVNKWTFGFANTKSLWEKLSPEDQKLFLFSMKDFDWEDYMQKCITGVRLHVFKDDPSTIPMARRRMAKFLILHKIIQLASIAFAAWILYTLYTLVASVGSTSVFASVTRLDVTGKWWYLPTQHKTSTPENSTLYIIKIEHHTCILTYRQIIVVSTLLQCKYTYNIHFLKKIKIKNLCIK